MLQKVHIYSKEEFEKIRMASKISSQILDLLYNIVKPNISTEEINAFVHQKTLELGGIPAPLNYHGFPKSVCTSVNDVVCHGIPSKNVILKDGDILNIDVTTILNGYYGDTSRMYCVGDSFKNKNLHTEKKKLIRVTYESMMMAINNIKFGGNLSEVGAIIQDHADKNNFSVVRDFCGHGIGSVFHEFPNVLHYKSAVNNIKLVPGMVFTIEPMINIGKYNVYIEKDNWTVRTKDKSLSAQFEHTIGILEDGTAEIFTKTNIDCLKEIYCD